MIDPAGPVKLTADDDIPAALARLRTSLEFKGCAPSSRGMGSQSSLALSPLRTDLILGPLDTHLPPLAGGASCLRPATEATLSLATLSGRHQGPETIPRKVAKKDKKKKKKEKELPLQPDAPAAALDMAESLSDAANVLLPKVPAPDLLSHDAVTPAKVPIKVRIKVARLTAPASPAQEPATRSPSSPSTPPQQAEVPPSSNVKPKRQKRSASSGPPDGRQAGGLDNLGPKRRKARHGRNLTDGASEDAADGGVEDMCTAVPAGAAPGAGVRLPVASGAPSARSGSAEPLLAAAHVTHVGSAHAEDSAGSHVDDDPSDVNEGEGVVSPGPLIVNGQKVYVVEKILKHEPCREGDPMWYFVRWAGYGQRADDWVRRDNLNAPEAVEAYWQGRAASAAASEANDVAASHVDHVAASHVDHVAPSHVDHVAASRVNDVAPSHVDDGKAVSPAAPNEGQALYVVEKILAHKPPGARGKAVKYRVRWAGYGSGEDSWEPRGSLKRCKEILDAYWQGVERGSTKRSRIHLPGRLTSGVQKFGPVQERQNATDWENDGPSGFPQTGASQGPPNCTLW